MKSNADRLLDILARAKHRADIETSAKKRARTRRTAESAADEHAARLAKQHRIRQLLADDRFDGMRFRWFFTRVQKDIPLDQLRGWVDSKIREEEERAKRDRQSA